MKRIVHVQDGATTANSAALEGVSPFLEGNSVISDINMGSNGTPFSGTAILEGSDDGTTWVTLHSTGAMTTEERSLRLEVVAKRFMRANVTRSAGEVTIAVESAL